MSLFVFLAVLGAALLHATWNALIKVGASKMTGMVIMTAVQGTAGLLIALGRPLPDGTVWLWLVASGVLHAAYKLFLAYAYEHGDLSRVYPIARGVAPLIVLALGAILLADVISMPAYAGIVILGLGILMMANGVFASGENRRLLPFALCSAMATAGYSLVDGMGARAAGDAATFVAWLFAFDAALMLPVAAALRGPAIFRAPLRSWGVGAIAAAGSYGAYAIAVWAMTEAPIALVAALR
jgi:drug/metabolite transporter (DMT)-like permease